MAVNDVAMQTWVAHLLSVLELDGSTARRKMTTILSSLGAGAVTSSLRERVIAHLDAAGIEAAPPPAEWTRSTPWVTFSSGGSQSQFHIAFESESELSSFIVRNWKRMPRLAEFAKVEAQTRLDGGRKVCDLLLTRRGSKGVVVVELKKGKPGNESVTELFGYVAALKAEAPARPVEAWLVSGKPNEDLVDDLEALSAAHGVPTRWFVYGVSLDLKEIR